MEENNQKNEIVKADGIVFDINKTTNNENIPLKQLRNFNDFLTFEVSVTIPYTDAADANFYPIFYVANTQCFLLEAKMKHGAAGGASAAVTVEKLISGTAKGAGGSMLISAFDLTAVANTVQSKTGTITLAGIQLAPGDSMALRSSGTLTNAQNVCVTVLLGVMNKDLPTGPNL